MKYGNCLIGTLILAVKYNFEGKFIFMRKGRELVPHFAWLSNDKCLTHYCREYDVLPWPLCLIFFRGFIEKLDEIESDEYLKSYNRRVRLNSKWERLDDTAQD